MAKPLELTGRVFGHLTVIKRVENNKHGRTMWLCQCDCTKYTTVEGAKLVNHTTISCSHVHKGLKAAFKAQQEKRIDGVQTYLYSGKLTPSNKTGVKGVSLVKYKDTVRFRAQITVRGIRHDLGTYDRITEAMEARRKGEEELIPRE